MARILWILFGLPCFAEALQCDDSLREEHDNSTGISYYFSNVKRNRPDAYDVCQQCGGSLAIVNSESVHNYSISKGTETDYWIGLQLSQVYSWTSPLYPRGEEITITGDSDIGSCVVSERGTLKFKACTEKYKIVCERACGIGTQHCYTTNSFKDTFMTAHIVCQRAGSYVTTFVDFNSSEPFWVGLSRYAWDDESNLYWQQWHGTRVIGTQKCVTLSSKIWENQNCTMPHYFICQRHDNYSTTHNPTTDKSATTTTSNVSIIRQTTTPDTIAYTSGSTSITTFDEESTTDIENKTYSDVPTTDLSQAQETIFTTASTTDVYTEMHLIRTTETLIEKPSEAESILIGSVVGAVLLLMIVIVLVIVCYKRSKRQRKENHKGDYDASYEIAFSPNTEDKTRNSDSSLTDDEKLAQLRNRDSRVVIDSNVPDSEKIKPYLVTTIVDGHGEGQPSRRREVVSFLEDRVEYDNNNLDDLIVTDNDLYHSSRSDPYRSNVRHDHTDYDYAAHPPNRRQPSPGNVFINNAYDREAEDGAVNDIQGPQIHYADIAFSTETLNKENAYADIDDFAPSVVTSDAEVPTTAGMDQHENTQGISNNDPDSGNQAGEMKAIPVYAEVDANKMDKNKNEIIDDRKDAHDLEEGVNDVIVTDNDLYDFNN